MIINCTSIRRVKCDEGRPICQRCVKFEVTCDGYKEGDKPHKNDSRLADPGPIVIRTRKPPPKTTVQTYTVPDTICRPPPLSLFKNDQEYQYFKVFTTQIASQLSGLFPTSLWNYLVLQACESNSSIRHAVIAIGALDPKTWRGPTKSPEDKLRRQFAYKQYSMAIGDMRKTISKKALDLRTRLISGLLFICFEICHFNRASAVAQIRAMSSLLEDGTHKRNDSNGLKVEEELEEVFRELKTQTLVYDCSGSLLSEKQILLSRQTEKAELPQQFDSMNQARSILFLLEVRQYYWTGSSGYDWPWYLATPVMGTASDPPPNEHTSNEDWCAERERRFEEYAVWSNAVQPLLFNARRANDPYENRRASLLKATFLTAYLSLMVPMLSPLEAYYGQTARLRELMDLIKSLLTTSSSADIGFSMEMNFVIPLSRICYRFRHRALRQEAINLLLSYPRREGLFDGVLIGTYSKWLAEIEEEGLRDEEEYVPHELVISTMDVDINAINKTAKLTAFQKVRNDPSKTVERQTIIKWS
ncbi:hypothetical protein N431DRAFT_439883 [Stipitochalara longipes BDJ]|nr:hypothetical protein N431DRAFT_439883 [Stipitochalara longipes BDJ]